MKSERGASTEDWQCALLSACAVQGFNEPVQLSFLGESFLAYLHRLQASVLDEQIELTSRHHSGGGCQPFQRAPEHHIHVASLGHDRRRKAQRQISENLHRVAPRLSGVEEQEGLRKKAALPNQKQNTSQRLASKGGLEKRP